MIAEQLVSVLLSALVLMAGYAPESEAPTSTSGGPHLRTPTGTTSVAARDYSPRIVFDLNYGSAEWRPGYLPFNEGDEVHPDAIAVTPSGRICITDPAKNRIAMYDLTTGRYVGELTRDGHLLAGVAWHPAGIATIDVDANEVVIFDERGREVRSQALSPAFNRSVWWLEANNEGIRVLAEAGYCLVYAGASTLTPVPPEQQEATARTEPSFGNHVYEYLWDGTSISGVVQRSFSGEALIVLPLNEDATVVGVRGEDAAGSFYVFTFAEASPGTFVETCIVFDASGAELARFPTEPGADVGETYVARDGVVYRLCHTDTHVWVVAYEPQ